MEEDFSWEETTVDEKEQEQWDVLFEQIERTLYIGPIW